MALRALSALAEGRMVFAVWPGGWRAMVRSVRSVGGRIEVATPDWRPLPDGAAFVDLSGIKI